MSSVSGDQPLSELFILGFYVDSLGCFQAAWSHHLQTFIWSIPLLKRPHLQD